MGGGGGVRKDIIVFLLPLLIAAILLPLLIIVFYNEPIYIFETTTNEIKPKLSNIVLVLEAFVGAMCMLLYGIYKVCDNSKKLTNEKRERDDELKDVFTKINTELDIKGESAQDTTKIINKIKDLKRQSENPDATKHLKSIARYMDIMPTYEITAQSICDNIKQEIGAYFTIKDKINNIYGKIPVQGRKESPIEKAEEIEGYVKRVAPNYNKYKGSYDKQKELSKKYKTMLDNLGKNKNEASAEYNQVLDELIKLIQNRNENYEIQDNIDNLINPIKSLCDKLDELKAIEKELENTKIDNIRRSISAIQTVLNTMRFTADESTIGVLDDIKNQLGELEKKMPNVSAKPAGLIEYVIQKQVNSIADLVDAIKTGIDEGRKASVNKEDTKAAIMSTTNDLEKLKNYTKNPEYDAYHHGIPQHYEKLIKELIELSNDKLDAGEIQEASIIINNAMEITIYTRKLYEESGLHAILRLMKKAQR